MVVLRGRKGLAPGEEGPQQQEGENRKMDVHGRIREILAETIREELAPDQQQLSTEDLIKALRRRGIIDDVMKELNFVTVMELEWLTQRQCYQ
uniref:CEP76 N-terminal domain-containing protein n=1 Tax=Equus asinus TaxID=9793 RepID=A0A9L0J7G0_EQUAS